MQNKQMKNQDILDADLLTAFNVISTLEANCDPRPPNQDWRALRATKVILSLWLQFRNIEHAKVTN